MIDSTVAVSLSVSENGPVTEVSTTATLPEAPLIRTGPLIVLWYRCTALASVARTGPVIDESITSSVAPDRTVTGPLTAAPSRQVTPVTVSAPLCSPVTVDV